MGLSAKELPNIKVVMKERGHLLIPLSILIYMLFGGFTPIYAAAWAIISTVVIAMFRKTTRMTVKSIAQALEEGTRAHWSGDGLCNGGTYCWCCISNGFRFENDVSNLNFRTMTHLF